jgi:hypothetical protein
MPRRVVERISNNRADRAGQLFRDITKDGLPDRFTPDRAALYAALDDIEKYRAMHEYPLTKVTMGVRQMLETELRPNAPRPGQRFKRMPRILEKPYRFPRMRLPRP